MTEKESGLKYYVYISDTKVDMLYEQIPHRLKDNIATELKIDLKFLSTTFSEEAKKATLISSLKVVENYIDKYEEVGSVDDSKSYFRGNMPLTWDTKRGAVIFSGITRDTFLVLGGSAIHMLGAKVSNFPSSDKQLLKFLPSTLYGVIESFELLSEEDVRSGSDEEFSEAKMLINDLQFYLSNFRRPIERPTQRYEFLVKRLRVDEIYFNLEKFYEPPEEKASKFLIGTPIYVALAE